MASGLEALLLQPPMPKTDDFSHSTGDEISLDDQVETPAGVLERLIDESDLLPVWFLEQGAHAQRAVARVVLTKPHTVHGHTFPPGTGWATGFMISSSLFLTNNHVIPDKGFLNKIRLQFNFQLRPDGAEQITESFFPHHGEVFHTNEALDYTIIRLRTNKTDTNPTDVVFAGDRWGIIPLNETPTFRKEQHLNIIQHPSGRRKEVALQNNQLARLFQNVIRYQADTEPGSSGSPVFDNLWQLVALHHAGGEQDANGKWLNNQGIRIDAIIEDMRNHFGANSAVLDELGIA